MKLKFYKKSNSRTKEQKEIIKQAKKIIIPRVEYYSKIMDMSYNRIAIRLQKTRWGSCSELNNLNFNSLLILMPVDVMDSVIIHELAHLKYMNHQNEFWNIVYKYFPKEKYKKCRQYLNKEGKEIIKRYLY